MLHEIYENSPHRLFKRAVRGEKDRLDFTEQYWLQKHPLLELNDDRFKRHYGISVRTFDWIVAKAGESEEYLGSQLRQGIPVEIQIALALWRFASTHFGFRIAEVHLGVSAGTYNNVANRFIDFTFRISASIISWPYNDPQRACEIADGFRNLGDEDKVRLDGIIGAMDGKNIIIQKPHEQGNDYIDRKGHASLNMLAVCDHLTRYTFIQVGETGISKFQSSLLNLLTCTYSTICLGRTHDARAFSNSKLCNPLIMNPDEMCPDGTYVIAGKLDPFLLF